MAARTYCVLEVEPYCRCTVDKNSDRAVKLGKRRSNVNRGVFRLAISKHPICSETHGRLPQTGVSKASLWTSQATAAADSTVRSTLKKKKEKTGGVGSEHIL